MIKNYFNDQELNIQLTEQITKKYSLPKNTSGCFCYICGELLEEADNEGIVKFIGGERVITNIIDDPVQVTIWKEAMYVISTYIKFTTPIPTKLLVSSIASGLRGVIGEQEARIFKSRTTTNNSIKETIILYSSIYVYAVLCSMMMINPNQMMFGRSNSKSRYNQKPRRHHDKHNDKHNDNDNDKQSLEKSKLHKLERKQQRQQRRGGRQKRYKGGKTTNNIKVYERFILTTALNLILITKNSIISNLSYINNDIVKQIFLKTAYPWARKYIKPIKLSVRDNSNKIFDSTKKVIDSDSFYLYLYYAKRLYYNSISKSEQKKIGAPDFNNIKSLLGRPPSKILSDLNENINIYQTITVPKKWSFNNELYDIYTYQSFITTFEYLKQEIYLKAFVPRHMQVEKYYEDSKFILDLEQKYKQKILKKTLHPMHTIDIIQDIQFELNDFRSGKISTNNLCINHQKHKIKSFVYKQLNGKTIDLTNEQINTWIKNKNVEKLAWFSTIKLVNERCGVCGQLVRTSKKRNIDDNLFTSVYAFYQYFKLRCPESDLHNFVNMVCTKCKLDLNKRHDTADAYYKKYISRFVKIEKEKQSTAINSLLETQKINHNEKIYAKQIKHKKGKEYQYTQKKLAEWSSLVQQINYNTLTNIGLTDDLNKEDILKAKINPSKHSHSDGVYINQALKVKNYILQTIREYNILLHYKNTSFLPLFIKDLIKQYKTKLNVKTLPIIGEDFIKLDDAYKYILSPKNYANFLLEYLSNIMVDLSDKTKKPQKVIIDKLIAYFTKKIITFDMLFSKPKSVYAKKKNESLMDNSDVITQDSDISLRFELESTDDTNENTFAFNNAYDVENVNDVWDIE